MTHYVVEDWADVGQALHEFNLAGWDVSLINWGENDSHDKWTIDIQIGTEIDDPDFSESDPDPIKAVERVYNRWKESMSDDNDLRKHDHP